MYQYSYFSIGWWRSLGMNLIIEDVLSVICVDDFRMFQCDAVVAGRGTSTVHGDSASASLTIGPPRGFSYSPLLQ